MMQVTCTFELNTSHIHTPSVRVPGHTLFRVIVWTLAALVVLLSPVPNGRCTHAYALSYQQGCRWCKQYWPSRNNISPAHRKEKFVEKGEREPGMS